MSNFSAINQCLDASHSLYTYRVILIDNEIIVLGEVWAETDYVLFNYYNIGENSITTGIGMRRAVVDAARDKAKCI